MKQIVLIIISIVIFYNQSVAQQKTIDQKVDSVLQFMTLEEKVGQLNQYSGRELTGPANDKKTNLLKDIKAGVVGSMLNVKGAANTREIQAVAMQSRMKIPLLFGLDVIHGYTTVFPVPLAEAASWDLDLMKQTAHIAAKEAAAAGQHWTFAPMVDVARDARWGRIMEGAGEDAWLGAQIAVARVKGFQGERLGGTDAVMACAKHFAAYGAAMAGRDYNAVDISDQQLWETYLPPFKAASDAGVATFMNAFNTINGIPATGNRYLQRTVLKNTWNFKGFVVSDWGSVGEMVPWGFAENKRDAALYAITAGSDMDMESNAYRYNLAELAKQGKIPVALINEAVSRILYKKFEMGLFDDPYKFSNETRETNVLNDVSHQQIAKRAAVKSIVLLKNNNDILPIGKKPLTIAVIGALAKSKTDMLGSWVVFPYDTAKVVTVWEGLQQRHDKNIRWLYAKGCDISGTDTSGFTEAEATIKKADLVVFVAGEEGKMTGEAKSRTSLQLPGQQELLFAAIQRTRKPVIALLMAGRPLVFPSIAAGADAILYTWWLGDQAGNAIADVLFGDYNPSGRLPVTFPRTIGQVPMSYNYYNTGRPVLDPKNIVYKSAYIDAPNTPQYAFGFGLSYTSFVYEKLLLSKTVMQADDSIKVSFVVRNTGNYAGEETAQLYLRDNVASVARPVKELKGFQQINLQPGEEKTVVFTIDKNLLSFYNSALQFVAEPGFFDIMTGASSDRIYLQSKIELTDK